MTTIADVARRAGVSTVTVSRVLNDARKVNPTTRERVERAIKELHYVPSVAARSLRSKRTNTLALIVPDISNLFWTTIVTGVEDVALSRGYSVFFCNTDERLDKQLRYLDVIISQGVDGAIIAPCNSDARKLKRLRDRDIPTVIIDRRLDGWDVDTVIGDSVSGARALVRHLIDLGHRRIAIVSGPRNTSTAEDRVIGYCLALTEAGIPIETDLIRRGEYRASFGERLTYQLVEEKNRPTAIFAANTAIALGIINALNRHGLRIPQDIALVCFDDFPFLSQIFPFLTVAVQPAHDMGVKAAGLLINRLDQSTEVPPSHIVLPTYLIIRYSCGSKGDGLSLPSIKSALPEEWIPVAPCSPEEINAIAHQLPDLRIPVLS